MRVFALTLLLIALPTFAIATPMESAQLFYAQGKYGIALEYAQPLADQGNADAQNMLGDMYFAGRGVATNPEEALKWYRKAADQGNPTAQNQLALMYMSGQCVKQDYAEAAKWYLKAAEKNDASAQTALGKMYFHGQGLQRDSIEAYYWLSLAAISGSREADSLRSSIASHLTHQNLSEVENRIAAWDLNRKPMRSKGVKIGCYGVIYKVTTDQTGKIASVALSRVENPSYESKETVVFKVPDSFEAAVRKLLSAESYEANATLYKEYLLDSDHPDRFCLVDKL